jgi:SAM-dependent methyltransferase
MPTWQVIKLRKLSEMSTFRQSSWKNYPGVAGTTEGYLRDPTVADIYDQVITDNVVTSLDLPRAVEFLGPCRTICDLGCGTGRFMSELAARGVEVLGIDLSWEMLRVARQRLGLPQAGIALIRANLVELDAVRDSAFDGAVCLFSTLGMIRGRDARREMLRHAFRILRPGGRFFVHAHNYWHLLRVRGGLRWLLRDQLRRFLEDPDAGDCDLAPQAGIAALALHHYRRSELVIDLRDAGFQVIRVEAISTRSDGRLPLRWFAPSLRAYGWFVGAVRPDS